MCETVSFPGRILFLSEDCHLIHRQIQGEDLDLSEALPLRDQISTDEITPGWVCYYFDHRLGDFPYIGLKCNEGYPVGEGAVRHGGFVASVAGKRRGKGSSREASPYAERLAGIRLVLAESFERIYLQNCQNLGIYASTDFGLIERLRAGEAIPIAEFTQGLDPITAAIVREGGLFAYGRGVLAGRIPVPVPEHAPGPMTLVEKIMARHAILDAVSDRVGVPRVRPGDGLFLKADWRFSHEYVTPMAASFLEQQVGPDAVLRDPASILAFRDHLTFLGGVLSAERRKAGLAEVALRLKTEQEAFCTRHGIRLHGERGEAPGSEGICHVLMLERYALPGQVVVGTDSHTPHSGALGALAFGVGTTDIACAWLTGTVRATVPPTTRIHLEGRLPEGVSAKDLILHLLALPEVREGSLLGHAVEFTGEALAGLEVDERATLTNMAAELGAFTGIVPPDEATQRFLQERRGLSLPLADWMFSDPDAEVAATLRVDCGALRPMVARPGDPGNGIPLQQLREDVPLHIAYAGSCTGGKREDLRQVHEVLAWGLAQGLKVHAGVRLYIQFGSEDVERHAREQGWIQDFEASGAILLGPGCGACINAGPGVSTFKEEVTVSAINRNFPGRSGPGRMWLASPATVAASAILGRLCAFEDLRLGT